MQATSISGPPPRSTRNLAPDYLSLRLRWFDAWLKGEPNGVAEEPPVRIFVMGGGSGRRKTLQAGSTTAGAGTPKRTGLSRTHAIRLTICMKTAGWRRSRLRPQPNR